MTISSATIWAGVVIVVLPALILAAGEAEERLRQRQSPFRRPVILTRNLVLPAFALWALLVPVLNIDRDSILVVIVASWLTIAVILVVLSVIGVLINVI
jgi:hypothetical protein